MQDYKKLVKALRETSMDFGELDDVSVMLLDAAAAIEELQTEVKRLEPKQAKLGEWIKAKSRGVVSYSDGYAECSSCHEVIWLGWSMNFCPHCGNQNKILDPDDFGNKTEPPQEV